MIIEAILQVSTFDIKYSVIWLILFQYKYILTFIESFKYVNQNTKRIVKSCYPHFATKGNKISQNHIARKMQSPIQIHISLVPKPMFFSRPH